MAIDTITHKVFAGYRRPAKFVVLDGKTGKKLSSNETVSDMDDVYFDQNTKEVVISGGGGFVNIFKQDQNTYKQVVNVPTRSGARTSLLIPQLRLFVLAERASGNRDAALLVYKITD
jgi:hypothetical protein